MSHDEAEKHLSELEADLDARELLEHYKLFTEKLHTFQERRREALDKLEAHQAEEEKHAREHFFEHHVASLQAAPHELLAQELEIEEALEEQIEEDLHLLREGQLRLKEELEAEETQRDREEKRNEVESQHALMELLTLLKEKREYYEHVLRPHTEVHRFNPRPILTPGGGQHGHGDKN